MAWVAINCPQCSAPLPRVAIWRSVKCPSCGALVTRNESIVTRDSFRQAWLRARQNGGNGHESGVSCGGSQYQLLSQLGTGNVSEVYLARRLGNLPILATLKLSSNANAAAQYAREAEVLRTLQSGPNEADVAYAAQCLPQVVACGPVEGLGSRFALILRHPNGYWGSLAALGQRFPDGIDPRHAVWIWRRMLDVLSFVHAQGWYHGDVRPEHALVHPRDHAVRLIGWGSAQKGSNAKAQATDLLRSARVLEVLLSGLTGLRSLSGRVPAGLVELIKRASEDEAFCADHGARGLDNLLRAAAREAYGAPAFVPLHV